MKQIFLTHPEFGNQNISYGFFGRKGGVSEGIYGSLNIGFGTNDSRENIEKNRMIIRESLGLSNLSTLYQIHSNICHVIDAPLETPLEGDALVTTKPNLAIGVLTADCAPVLFHAKTKSGDVIGAAHAGWGGALKGILDSTIDIMIKQGAIIETMKAFVGPCIGQTSYEVSVEFLNPFLERDTIAEKFFTPSNSKFKFDLPRYAEFRLRACGVDKIIQANRDTYLLEDDYFSYRRKTHRNEPDYGRQMSVICIKNT